MFGLSLLCGIRKVTVKGTNVEGVMMRRCRVVLSHPFDLDIANELGSDGRNMLAALKSGGAEKVVMPIDRMQADGAFVAGEDVVTIGHLIGVKATGAAAKQEDESPTIQLEFEFPWDVAAWAFLGLHCNASASVTLTKRQQELSFGAAASRVTDAADRFRKSVPRGTTMSLVSSDGRRTKVLGDDENGNDSTH